MRKKEFFLLCDFCGEEYYPQIYDELLDEVRTLQDEEMLYKNLEDDAETDGWYIRSGNGEDYHLCDDCTKGVSKTSLDDMYEKKIKNIDGKSGKYIEPVKSSHILLHPATSEESPISVDKIKNRREILKNLLVKENNM